MSKVRSADLVLRVSEQSDFALEPYEPFLQALTLPGGPHQLEALRVACRYLLGGHYKNLLELAEENWDDNPLIREHTDGHQRERFLKAQQLGSLLACSIDHATATGKSYVIFGAAMVALASGQVDRVLVLCPSVTIEEGLTRKFRELAADKSLMDLLPEQSAIRVPAVVNAYEQTVPAGAICVENIHAAYDGSASSIHDSFQGQGERTLVINDEAHHVYTVEGGKGKMWLKFLLDPIFAFRRVLNASGTCWIGDAYFPDVIHRYSLQEARSDRRIKDIRYWGSDQDFPSDEARWSAVLVNHQENQRRFPKIKPITIFVCQKVETAKELHRDFTAFLAKASNISEAAAAERTLPVSSDEKHKKNLPILRVVDQQDNKVEFIFSVSMLTEGWDVKNVLQIVPHEKRAFDSKLLISQVLGRGLRLLPDPYRDAASVIIFNHAKWAPEMKRLFDDVWEDDQRIVSASMLISPHHFTLEQLETKRGDTPVDDSADAHGRSGGQSLRLAPQHDKVTFGTLVDLAGKGEERKYKYAETMSTLDEVINDVLAKNAARSLETGEPGDDLNVQLLRTEIETALKAVGAGDGLVSEANRSRILNWLMPPQTGRRMAFRTIDKKLVFRSTAALQPQSIGRSELGRGDASIALRTDNNKAFRWPNHDSGQYDLLDAVLADVDDLPGKAIIQIPSEQDWRTPVDVVNVTHAPERRFLKELLRPETANGIKRWIKSPDSGFYAIQYVLQSNGVVKNLSFNPDWFLCVGDDVLVVETKADGDLSDENRAKLKSAREHFEAVNDLWTGEAGSYFFYFLSPSDYTAFFEAIQDGTYATFVSSLQADLQ